MSLSPGEIVSIVVGLAGGFWLVSRVMEADFSDDNPSEDPAPDRRQGSSDEPRAEDVSGAGAFRPSTWWSVLDVLPTATRDEIALAYKRKISQYHPDKVAQMGEEIRAVAERKSKEVNAAYEEATRR